jgi:hypothetical protein
MKVILSVVSVIALALAGQVAANARPDVTVSAPPIIAHLLGVLRGSPAGLLLPPHHRSKDFWAACDRGSQLHLRI